MRLYNDTAGNLDPSSSVQGISILAGLPRTTRIRSIGGRTASPRGGSMMRQHKNKNIGAPIQHGKISQDFAGNGPGAIAAAPRGGDHTPLSGNTWRCRHSGSSGDGKKEQDRARGGDASASIHSQKKTVFVRSKQWGQRRPDWTESQRQGANESGLLGVHPLALMGGKRQRPPAAGERAEYGRAASRRSTATKMVRIAQSSERHHGATRRTNGEARDAAEGNQSQPREGERVESPAIVADEGPVQGEKAGKMPSAVSASLVSPPMVVSPERLSPCIRYATSMECRIAPSPVADSKLRPDNSQRRLYHRQAPRWCAEAAEGKTNRPETTEGTGLLATEDSISLPASSADTRLPATVATKMENSAAPGSAVAVTQPAERVPQPLSVVAVWSRRSSQREDTRKNESSSRAGVNSPRAAGWRVGATEGLSTVGSDYQELSGPLHSATLPCRETGTAEAPFDSGASR